MTDRVLAAGASTQSRANRPLPEGGRDVACLPRDAGGELRWGDGRLHHVDVTWTFDQGGPVLGYTCDDNPLTAPVLRTVAKYGMLGPGSVVSWAERDAARSLVGVVGPFLRSDDPRV